MSRLTIDITDQQHQSLKALAALQGKTIKQYALERLFPDDANGERAWEELKTLMNTRINDGLAGKLSTKTVGEILGEEIAEDRA
ncbi:antitoxin [Rhizobium hidalgonense]|uniref:antitoxin n=1 Tax=Rhizobium hidalgonense TaxID=1538159 RepID=UPI000FEC5CEF|nr:antitoxin [Rhizobium hidalgonense]RWX14159.1 antitoxin [Rhizobium hidalgonense]